MTTCTSVESPVPRAKLIDPFVVVGVHVIVKTVPTIRRHILERTKILSRITCLKDLSRSRRSDRLHGQLARENFKRRKYVVLSENG